MMIYLSTDDGAMIHERFSIILNHFGVMPTDGLFHYSWTIVAIILVLVVYIVFAKFFLSLPVRSRWLFALSGVVFLSGALGIEMYTSYIVSTAGVGVKPIIIGLEETLEVAGISILVYALLYITIFSVVIFYTEKMELLGNETIQASQLLSYHRDGTRNQKH